MADESPKRVKHVLEPAGEAKADKDAPMEVIHVVNTDMRNSQTHQYYIDVTGWEAKYPKCMGILRKTTLVSAMHPDLDEWDSADPDDDHAAHSNALDPVFKELVGSAEFMKLFKEQYDAKANGETPGRKYEGSSWNEPGFVTEKLWTLILSEQWPAFTPEVARKSRIVAMFVSTSD